MTWRKALLFAIIIGPLLYLGGLLLGSYMAPPMVSPSKVQR